MRTLEQVRAGLLRYLHAEILPKLPPDVQGSIGIRGFLSYAELRGDKLLMRLAQKYLTKMDGVITDEGVDVDFLRDWGKMTIPEEGLPVSIALNPLNPASDKLELVVKPVELDLIYDYLMGVK